MTDETEKTSAEPKQPEYRMVRRGRGANMHMVPLKRRKGRGRRCLKIE